MRPDNRYARDKHQTLGQLVNDKMAVVAICWVVRSQTNYIPAFWGKLLCHRAARALALHQL
jgi:hypothetical protein